MRKLTIIAALFVSVAHGQHSALLIQHMHDALLINPAYAGSKEALALTALVRNQWTGIEGAPFNISLTGHAALKNRNFAAGFSLQNERFGLIQNTTASAIYAYRINMRKHSIAMAIQGGAALQQTNISRIRAIDNNDPGLFASTNQQWLPKVSAGLYYQGPRGYAGISATDLVRTGFNPYYTASMHAGLIARCGENYILKPAILLRNVKGSPLMMNFSGMLYYKDIAGAGAGVTLNNAFMILLDFKVNQQFYFCYGFERAMTRLQTMTMGSHELMLRYLFKYRIKATDARYF